MNDFDAPFDPIPVENPFLPRTQPKEVHLSRPLPPAFVKALGVHMLQAESMTGMKWEDPDRHSTNPMWVFIIVVFVGICAAMPWVV